MAITENDITWPLLDDDYTWLSPGFSIPARTAAEDAKSWSVWADMSHTKWAEENRGFPLACLGRFQGTSAHFLVERMYEIYGDKVRLGIKLERIV
jgi:hypothetical protein